MSLETEKRNQDLNFSISVSKSPKEVYDAIRKVKSWWTGEIKGDADHVGSVFTYHYKDKHKSTQKVTELVPGKKVVWHVEDADLSFLKNRAEWKGTDIVFEIFPKGSGTELRFTHRGLTPDSECYEACSGGWGFYITKSLKNLINEGKGLNPSF